MTFIDLRDVTKPTRTVYRIGNNYYQSPKHIREIYQVHRNVVSGWIRNRKTAAGDVVRVLTIDSLEYIEMFGKKSKADQT